LRGELLERIQRQIGESEFAELEHSTAHRELKLETGKAVGLLTFLTNDPALFEVVRGITGCDRIGSYTGRVYRMLPGAEHEGKWHTDLLPGRMVAMSINLSEAPYSGGVLEIREQKSKNVLQRVTNNGFGDAVIFRIDSALAHRLTAVEGDTPKTAFAGWFFSGEDSVLLRPHTLFSSATGGDHGDR
jgi:hypothetical protein